jgi:hypothetical protein
MPARSIKLMLPTPVTGQDTNAMALAMESSSEPAAMAPANIAPMM